MHTNYHAKIGAAEALPTSAPTPILSVSPVVIAAIDRQRDLEVKVTVPTKGTNLPILLFSHGAGPSNWLSSLEGYAPICEFYAAHGFAVFQPTHLRSRFLGLTAPEGQEFFHQSDTQDLSRILDSLENIEDSVPGLKGRLDKSKVAVAGHSAGSMNAYLALGATNNDPRNGTVYHKPEPRIKVGCILGGVGTGGKDLAGMGLSAIPFWNPDFKTLLPPTLVVYGDEDDPSYIANRGVDWHFDVYTLGPAPKDALSIRGGKHGLGGISGWDAAETKDESPEMLGIVQRMTWAYLWTQLHPGDKAWENACKAFEGLGQGKVESK